MAVALSCIEEDHRRIEGWLSQLQEGAEGAPASVLDGAGREVTRHLATVLQVLYPYVVRTVEGGDDLAKAARLGFEEIELQLQRLRSVPMSTQEFRTELGRFIAAVRQQMHEEESRVVEVLRQVAPPEALADLDRRLARAGRHAMTRPHPHVPKSAVGFTLSNAVMGAADRLRQRLHR